MSIHVTDFKWEKGKNDLQYIELLERTLKNEQAITGKSVAKIRELAKGNKKIRNKTLDEIVNKMKSRYFHRIGTQFDNAILEMEKLAEKLKQ